MYRKILLPLDGSNLAECAIEHAKEIAGGCHVSEVDIITVIKTYFWWEDDITDPEILQEIADDEKSKAQDYLAKEKRDLENAGLFVKTAILEGNAADQILDYAEKNGVDLIVMSTHGRGGATRFAFGSVTDKVIRTSPTPVMAIAPAGCRVAV